jgi:putative endopeptidase
VDYRPLVVKDDDLCGNVLRAAQFDWDRNRARLRHRFDRSEWFLPSDQVNYSYDPSTNTVEIPAGTFEAPFFDPAADPAVNYGAMGSLIGAQMVAAFDDLGRHFDATGRLKDWWTTEEQRAFQSKFSGIIAQYSKVEALPGLHIKGVLVANEAVDDLGGLLIALDAYHRSLTGTTPPVRDGFTGDQRFFLGRAQMWRAKFQEAFIRTQNATGHNAPPFMRVNGPLPNIDAWYEAFGVRPGDSLYLAPADRVRIW